MKSIIIFIIGIIIMMIPVSFFTVYETEKVIVSMLGKLKLDVNGRARVYEPGLHFRIPFLQDIHVFDTRLKLLDVQSSRITTSEKKDVLVDFYLLWQTLFLKNLLFY